VKFHSGTLSGVVAPRAFSPRGNFLAGGQTRRLPEIDRHYDDTTTIWQESVYEFARAIADSTRFTQVVDIGTGTGVKFQRFFAGYSPNTLQTDWIDQRVRPNDESTLGEFKAGNLELFDDLEALEAALPSGEPMLFVLSDIIEHLQDVRPLLRTLRRLLKQHDSNRLVLSTPDRHRIDGLDASRLPDNRGHVRQWTLGELGRGMLSAGFRVHQIGWVPQHELDDLHRTICCELSCSSEYYLDWLANHNLPPPSDHLILTTEHAKAHITGGIGTYVSLSQGIDGKNRLIVFGGLTGVPHDDWLGFVRERGWLHIHDLCNNQGAPVDEVALNDPDGFLRAVLQAIFIYDGIRLIEYQDYLGIGYRVAQAKLAGLLPQSITVMAYAHGNHFYLDAAAGAPAANRSLAVDVTERLSVELADVVAFPSRYLRDLYIRDAGFRVRAQRYLPYPIIISENGLNELTRGPIQTLVFYGKQTAQKGYFEFVDAVVDLFTNPAYSAVAAQIKRVVLLGVTNPDLRLAELPVAIEHGVFSLREVVAMLHRFAPAGLVILPYRGDNHPLSVFEVVEANCQLLAFDVGGLPELLPPELKPLLLCCPNANSLATAIEKVISLTHWERCNLVRDTRELIRKAYLSHAEAYKAFVEEMKRGTALATLPATIGQVTVIIPNLNGEARLLADAADGLRNSFHRPAKVIIVDDGSSEVGRLTLDASLSHFGNLNVDLVFNSENRGLAGARNVGLARATTPYVCAHDNDNIVLNRFLQVACRILDLNSHVAAVTCYSRFFDDGTPWQTETWGAGYRPTGADLGYALLNNTLGDALAVYRVADLREVGGWNETSKAKWEDWELFLKLVARGKDIWVIPEEQVLYRVRPDSMLRRYKDFPGWLRLSNAFDHLPKAQAIGVLHAIWNPLLPTGESVEALYNRLNSLNAELLRVKQSRPLTEDVNATDRKLKPRAARWLARFVRHRRQRRLYYRMRAVIASSKLFDRNWYLRANADVASAGMDPVEHYIKYGAAEGRDPGPFFSTRGYLAANSDVDAAGVNPLFHYLQFGRLEGRKIQPAPAHC
jgi:glycosyltransferase involved in cell wall biosynthesis